jgi:hypothetical protein
MPGWLPGLGQVTDAGVKGTGSYGYRLARLLADRGIQVWEVNCPDRSRRRRKGKINSVRCHRVITGDCCSVHNRRLRARLHNGPLSHQVIALAATGQVGMAAAGRIRLAVVTHRRVADLTAA